MEALDMRTLDAVAVPADLVGRTWGTWTLGPDPDGMDRWLACTAWRHGLNQPVAHGPEGLLVGLIGGTTRSTLVVHLLADQGAETRAIPLGVPEFDRVQPFAPSMEGFLDAVRDGRPLPAWQPSDDQRALMHVWLDGNFDAHGRKRLVGRHRPGARLSGWYWHQYPYWRELPEAEERLRLMDARAYSAALETMLPHRGTEGVALEAGCIARALGRADLALTLFREAGSEVDEVDLLVAEGRLDEAREVAGRPGSAAGVYASMLGVDLPEVAPAEPSKPAAKPRRERNYRRSAAAITGDHAELRRNLLRADEKKMPRAHAELGLALYADGAGEDAWTHLEAAAMGLPASGALTKKVFAALDDLEAKGFAR